MAPTSHDRIIAPRSPPSTGVKAPYPSRVDSPFRWSRTPASAFPGDPTRRIDARNIVRRNPNPSPGRIRSGVGTKSIGDFIHSRRRQATQRRRATTWNRPARPQGRACRTHSSRALQFSWESLREESASSQICRRFVPWNRAAPTGGVPLNGMAPYPGLQPLVTADGRAVEGPPPSKRHEVSRRSPTDPRAQGRRDLREIVAGYIRIRIRQGANPTSVALTWTSSCRPSSRPVWCDGACCLQLRVHHRRGMPSRGASCS
jgi:hypothetical protein